MPQQTSVPFYLKCVSHRQHMPVFSLFIQSHNLCLSAGAFLSSLLIAFMMGLEVHLHMFPICPIPSLLLCVSATVSVHILSSPLLICLLSELS